MESESTSEEDEKVGNVENGRALTAARSVACELRNIGDELWRYRRQRGRRQQQRRAEMTILRNLPTLVCMQNDCVFETELNSIRALFQWCSWPGNQIVMARGFVVHGAGGTGSAILTESGRVTGQCI